MSLQNGKRKFGDLSTWYQDVDMANWMIKNYSRLSTTNDGIFFLMHMLKTYFSNLITRIKDMSTRKIRVGKIVNYTELVDEFIFDKIFVSETEYDKLRMLPTTEPEIYLALCRYFYENIDLGIVGYFIIDFLFADVKKYRKNVNFQNNRELKLFFMQNLVSTALSFYSPTLLECIAYVLCDCQWYDRIEKFGGRVGENSPMNVIKQIFYETCATVPVGEQLYMDLPRDSPIFSFLTLYTVTCNYVGRIIKDKIQDNMFEKYSSYIEIENDSVNEEDYIVLRSPPLYYIRILKYWLENYRYQITNLKLCPYSCLPTITMETNFINPNTVHNCIIFNSTFSNLLILSIVSPLWKKYDILEELTWSIHFELLDYIHNMSLEFSNICDSIKKEFLSSIADLSSNSNDTINEKKQLSNNIDNNNINNIDSNNSYKNYSTQSSSQQSLAELEEGEISSDIKSPCEEGEIENDDFDGNSDICDSNGDDNVKPVGEDINDIPIETTITVANNLFITSEENLNTMLVFYGTFLNDSNTVCSCDILGDDQQWLRYLNILANLNKKLGTNPYFSVAIERFCQLFSAYISAKSTFTIKDLFIEYINKLKDELVYNNDANLDNILNFVKQNY